MAQYNTRHQKYDQIQARVDDKYIKKILRKYNQSLKQTKPKTTKYKIQLAVILFWYKV